MRDIVVSIIVFGIAPLAIVHPWIGTLLWAWIGLMNPHRLTYGFAHDFPFAYIVAIATLIGVVVTRDRKTMIWTAPTILLLLFVMWMGVTSIFALYPTKIDEMLYRVMKIQLMIFITLSLLNSKRHLLYLVIVIVFSLGFYGVKGGIFTLATGGGEIVWGPPGSFVEGNNEIALALVMIIPLMYFLYQIDHLKWRRYALVVAMILVAVSALGSQSRGGFLALCAMGTVLWYRSQKKLMALVVIVALGATLIAFMPSKWESRMKTIETYQTDASAMGRINAWYMAFNLASDRWIGGGFEVITPELFQKYAPNPLDVHAAHSIYFQVLGEHGWVGLSLFLGVWWTTWRMAGRIRKMTKDRPNHRWMYTLGGMIQVSMMGYLVGGAFLTLAYFDLPYYLVVITVVCKGLLDHDLQAENGVSQTIESQEMTRADVRASGRHDRAPRIPNLSR